MESNDNLDILWPLAHTQTHVDKSRRGSQDDGTTLNCPVSAVFSLLAAARTDRQALLRSMPAARLETDRAAH